MYKLMSFLQRRPDLQRPAFFDWWLNRLLVQQHPIL
jgi:hypothetical protein